MRFVAEIPDGSVADLEGTHYLFIDRRDTVVAAVQQFWARHGVGLDDDGRAGATPTRP